MTEKNTPPKKNDEPGDLIVSKENISELEETGRWATNLAIIGFASAMVLILGGISFYINLPDFPAGFVPDETVFPMITVLPAFFTALILIFPFLYLLKFAGNIRIAIRKQDPGQVKKGIRNLKSIFIYVVVAWSIGILGFMISSIWLMDVIKKMAAHLCPCS